MPDKKISELAAASAAAGANEFAINEAGTTKKVTLTQVGDFINASGQSISPTDLKISTASKGGVFNPGFELGTKDTAVTASGIIGVNSGWYLSEDAGQMSAELDTAIANKGLACLKLEAIDTSGGGVVYNTSGVTLPILALESIPLKVSTVYKLTVKAKTNLVGSNGVFAGIIQYDSAAVVGTTIATNKLSTTNDWTILTITFTSDNDAAFGRLALYNNVAGTVNQAWFDDITLEEVVTDTSFTGKIAEKIKGVLQAVTSTDNTDNSLDSAGAYANTYALTNAINEGATHIQTFTPTKKYTTQIAVWPVAKGTGNWTLVVHTAGNVIVASKTIANASVVEGAMLYFDVPNIWTSGALHFHLYSSVADGTCKANTSNDLETASYIQRYAKKTETFSLIANGIKTELKADKDGLLSNSIIDLDNGKYLYDSGVFGAMTANVLSFANNVFSATAGGRLLILSVINDWYSNGSIINSKNDAVTRTIILRVNTILPIKHLKFLTKYGCFGGGTATFQISADNVTYTTLHTQTVASNNNPTAVGIETDLMNGLSTFYIKLDKASSVSDYFEIGQQIIEADIDTSSIPQGLLYPIGTNQFTETLKLPSSATRVYFRLNKFQNENGVVVPALEYTDASAVNIGYTPLKLDNSQETNPCVDIIIASTTNGQQSGTGSNDSTTGYILNDGEYMTLSTAVAELTVTFKVGGGTTSFANITKNALYLSSNGEGNDATQDPSHQGNFIVGVPQQGLVQSLASLRDDVQNSRKHPALGYGEMIASGTAYTLTTSLALVTFGTSGALQFLLPDKGIYEITAEIVDDASAVTASAAANYSLYQLYVDSVAMTGAERAGIGYPIIVAALAGVNKITHKFKWIVSSQRAGTLVGLFAKCNSATTGAWTITSGATGETRLSYKRIG